MSRFRTRYLGPYVGERIVTRRRVDLAAFTRELALSDHDAFPLYPTDVVFGLYSRMLGLAKTKGTTISYRWGEDSTFGRLGGPLNIFEAERLGVPFSGWMRDIRKRIAIGLLGSDPILFDWRKRIGWEPLRPIQLHGMFHEGAPFRCLDDELDALFNLFGRRTKARFNRSHRDAVYIVRVGVFPDADAWTIRLGYGVDGSVWDDDYRHATRRRYPLAAQQGKNESLLTFVRRARRQFETWLLPEENATCSSDKHCIPSRWVREEGCS
jgi:hypothetical protein